WWKIFDYFEHILDQYFGVSFFEDDLLSILGRSGRQANIVDSGQSEVKNENDKFQIELNVSQFKLEELDVQVVDEYVEIHRKHKEKSDEHGFVSREFTRRNMLSTHTRIGDCQFISKS
ncbi:unnamed protein product, partial [Larinioides sclopetarius]